MLIHLIRHTTPDIEKDVCYGQADIPLTRSFPEERDAVLKKLLPEYDALYTSPLIRCAHLAESIQAKQRFTDDRIKEYSFGDWELEPWSAIKKHESKAWMDDFVNIPSPNGESMKQMQERVEHFFEELYSSELDKVAVVTHSGVQRLIHADILETSLNNIFRLQLDFGAVLELSVNHKTGLKTVKHL